MDSTAFPFGANAPETEDTSVRTLAVTESDVLAWRDIEALRVAARADVGTVVDSHWTRAMAYIARLKIPVLRTWSANWVAFCLVGGKRPVRHIGDAGKACRRVELELARLGIVDPEGFEARERPAVRASKTRAMRRRQQRGGDCNGLKEFNERMRSPWIS